MRRDLGAGVTGADHHKGAAGFPFGVAAAGGQLELAQEVVTKVERLGDAAEPVAVLGDAGNGQQLVDAARGEQQPVVGHDAAIALGPDHADPPAAEIDLFRCADQQPGSGAGIWQRHGHPARIQHAAGHLGQQRQVQEIVGRVDQHDLDPGGLLPAEVPGQSAQGPSGVEPSESSPDDHDPLAVARFGHDISWSVDFCTYAWVAPQLPGQQAQT